MTIQQIFQSVTILINNAIAKLSYDKTISAVVYTKSGDLYGVNYNNRVILVPNGTGVTIPLGSLVWLKIPNCDKTSMYICNLRYK